MFQNQKISNVYLILLVFNLIKLEYIYKVSESKINNMK